ncbi:MAG: ABC-F family ATP-binding cassette domain-containing protein [Pseudomonadota bacterium]
MVDAPLVTLAGINLTFGGTPLFEGATIQIGSRDRIALVGRNGCGKSTFLKVIAGAIEPDAGERFAKPGAAIGYLEQEPDYGDCKTVSDYLATRLSRADDLHRSIVCAERLGVRKDQLLSSLSGGEARKTALAAVLNEDADILLLDEPTNHLDLPSINWLEEQLNSKRCAIVLISHDRRFLKTISTQTIWIDRGTTRRLSRGFGYFEDWRDAILEEEERDRHKLARKIVREEHWMRYGVTARRKRNMRRVGELQALRSKLRDARGPAGAAKMKTADATPASKRIIKADDISITFDENTIVSSFSTEIRRGDRVGIVGPNGAGKTTLIDLLTGNIAPDSGSVSIADNAQFILVDQKRSTLDPTARVADAITDGRGDWVSIGEQRKHVSGYLQDFLFGQEQWRAPVSSLSGGERGRLAIAAALARPSNVMVLDEPTNDLDLETLDVLEDLLASYAGALLLVSHDRDFLDRTVTSIITTDPEIPGRWRRYVGGYDDMVAQRGTPPGERVKVLKPKLKTPKKPPKAPQKPSNAKLSYKEKYALETLPKKIAELEKKVTELNAELADPALFQNDPERFNRSATDLRAVEEALAASEEEWLALEMKREALEAEQ